MMMMTMIMMMMMMIIFDVGKGEDGGCRWEGGGKCGGWGDGAMQADIVNAATQ